MRSVSMCDVGIARPRFPLRPKPLGKIALEVSTVFGYFLPSQKVTKKIHCKSQTDASIMQKLQYEFVTH